MGWLALASPGLGWPGLPCPGLACPGLAWFGQMVWPRLSSLDLPGLAWPCLAGLGVAWSCLVSGLACLGYLARTRFQVSRYKGDPLGAFLSTVFCEINAQIKKHGEAVYPPRPPMSMLRLSGLVCASLVLGVYFTDLSTSPFCFLRATLISGSWGQLRNSFSMGVYFTNSGMNLYWAALRIVVG